MAASHMKKNGDGQSSHGKSQYILRVTRRRHLNTHENVEFVAQIKLHNTTIVLYIRKKFNCKELKDEYLNYTLTKTLKSQ